MTAEEQPSHEPPPTADKPSGGIRRLYWRAFDDNLTGMAGMVAYNLLLSVFPLALLALFIASHVLQSEQLQTSVFEDLQRLFPSAAESTLLNLLDNIRTSTTSFGIVALVASIWIGSSFWGALDTAFCRIYHLQCRPWLKQKRFGIAMLAVSLVFIAATVAVPALQSIVVAGAEDLPLGLSDVEGLVFVATLAGGIALLFAILSVIYWAVPHGRMPWRAIWPGALGATIAIAVVDYAFPAYLSGISTLAGLGTSLIFIVIVLLWFYALAIIILAGAEINALRLPPATEPTVDAETTRDDGQPAPDATVPAAPPGRAASTEGQPAG